LIVNDGRVSLPAKATFFFVVTSGRRKPCVVDDACNAAYAFGKDTRRVPLLVKLTLPIDAVFPLAFWLAAIFAVLNAMLYNLVEDAVLRAHGRNVQRDLKTLSTYSGRIEAARVGISLCSFPCLRRRAERCLQGADDGQDFRPHDRIINGGSLAPGLDKPVRSQPHELLRHRHLLDAKLLTDFGHGLFPIDQSA
jgi:predicted outer membrane lipoprotein